jgi:hypothetical protein
MVFLDKRKQKRKVKEPHREKTEEEMENEKQILIEKSHKNPGS